MAHNNKLISVIVPAYNAEKYIGKCIDSVLAQTYRDWELISVDDGSQDGTLGILKRYAKADCRIRVIRQVENQGPGIARNTGIAEAKGKYVVFIDSDDYIEKDYFQLLSEHDEDVVFINVRNVDEEGRVLKEDHMSKNKRLTKETILRRQMTGMIDWGGVRKSLNVNILRKNSIGYTNHIIGEEALYSFQVLWYAKSVSFIDKPLYNYVQRSDSQSNRKVDDPWGAVALSMKEKVTEMGLYPKFADSINAFLLTASAVSANCLVNNHSFSIFLTEVKKCRNRLNRSIDNSYPIDKANMSNKARLMGWLLRHGFFRLIWILSKLKEIKR